MASNESEIEALVVKLEADVTSFRAQMMAGQESVVQATKAMSDAIQSFSEGSGRQMSMFQNIAQTALGVFSGEAILEGVHAAGELIADVFREIAVEGVKAAAASQGAMNRLNNAMAMTGEFSRGASADFEKFAEHLSLVTTASETTIISQLALAKTFGATNEQAKTVVETATKIAATGLMSLDEATRAVAGTLSGFTRGPLARAVPGLKDLSEEALKAGQGIALLHDRFAGQGAGAIQTFSGAMAQAHVAFEQFAEQLGKTVVENQVVTAAIQSVTEGLRDMREWVKNNETEIKNWVSQGIIVASSALATMVDALDIVYRTGKIAFDGLMLGATGTHLAFWKIDEAVLSVVSSLTKNIPVIGDVFKNMLDFVHKRVEANTADFKAYEQGAVSAISHSSDAAAALSSRLTDMGAHAKAAFANLQSGASASVQPINQVTEAVKQLSFAEQQAGDAGKKLADELSGQNAKKEFDEKLKVWKAEKDAGLITEREFYAQKKKLIQQNEAAELQQLKAAYQQKKISHDQYQEAIRAEHLKTNRELIVADDEFTKATMEQNRQRAQDQYSTLGYISQLQKSSNQELFAVGKAAAVATATVDGIMAVQKALGAFPPPFNFAMAALVGAATATNVSKIASSQPPRFNTGGTVPGSGFGDKTPILAEPGEEVVDRRTSEKMRKFFDGDNKMLELLEGVREAVLQIPAKISQGPITIQVGGKTIAEVLRQEIRGGRAITA